MGVVEFAAGDGNGVGVGVSEGVDEGEAVMVSDGVDEDELLARIDDGVGVGDVVGEEDGVAPLDKDGVGEAVGVSCSRLATVTTGVGASASSSNRERLLVAFAGGDRSDERLNTDDDPSSVCTPEKIHIETHACAMMAPGSSSTSDSTNAVVVDGGRACSRTRKNLSASDAPMSARSPARVMMGIALANIKHT